VSPNIIRPPISDNKKLTLKEYRNILYDQIKKLYREDPPSKGIEIVTPKRKSESKEKDKRSQHSLNDTHNSSNSKSRK